MIANLFRIDKEYVGIPAAIASYAQYATRADGPAIWETSGSRDIPFNSDGYSVRILKAMPTHVYLTYILGPCQSIPVQVYQ